VKKVTREKKARGKKVRMGKKLGRGLTEAEQTTGTKKLARPHRAEKECGGRSKRKAEWKIQN